MLATTHPFGTTAAVARQSLIARWRDALRASVAKVDAAHECRRTVESVPAHLQHDVGLSPEEASGVCSWQPDLPFFMQKGFGRS